MIRLVCLRKSVLRAATVCMADVTFYVLAVHKPKRSTVLSWLRDLQEIIMAVLGKR